MRVQLLTSLLLVMTPLVGIAQEQTSGTAQVAVNAPSSTEMWLELQRSGQMASANAYRASSAEQERSVKRWLDSFGHAIPDFFERIEIDDDN